MKIFDLKKMDELCEAAKASPRKRAHFNLHESLEDPIQRLCIAIEPDSVFDVHRHETKFELFTILRGSATAYFYDDTGAPTASRELGPGKETAVIEIPPGVWHNYVVHESGTVALETKPGPYRKFTNREIAPFPGIRPEKK